MKRFADLTHDEQLTRWRHPAIVNTCLGVVTAVAFLAALRTAIGLMLALLIALGVADTGYLDRRFRRTGSLVEKRRPPAGSSGR